MADYLLLQLEPFVLLATTLVFACGTYLVWPSRWNVPAHLQLAFWTVTFLIPAGILQRQDAYSVEARLLLMRCMLIGAFFYATGLLVGASASTSRLGARLGAKLERPTTISRIESRTRLVVVVGIAFLAGSLLVMGFVPMFADDAFAAKFFRGSYAEAYQPVAVYYRAGTAALAALMALVAGFAYLRRTPGWWAILTVAVGLMVVTLQRGPAVGGLLLFVGVLMVGRRRTGTFLAISLSTYVVGTLFYAALSVLGVGAFSDAAPQTQQIGFLDTVASTAPDLTDGLDFLERWDSRGRPETDGRTFYGGLVPNNYPWNPGVWTITLGDPSVDISQTVSGGLRLPAPVWGLVSFGLPGVIGVCGISGLIIGLLSALARDTIENRDPIGSLVVLTVYGTAVVVLGGFYTLSYLSAAQALLLVFILVPLRPRIRPTDALHRSASRVVSAR